MSHLVPATFAIPQAYPLVGVGLLSNFMLNLYQMTLVGAARKKAKIAYPNLYATDEQAKASPEALAFNCTQRTHGNTLEIAPYIIALTLFFGLFHPKLATIFNLLWCAGKLLYTNNYISIGPAGRNNGLARVSYIGVFGLLFGSIYVTGLATYQILF